MSDEYQGDDDAPARIDTGYRPKPVPVADVSKCRKCNTATEMLHQDPDRVDECRRAICGVCAGRANRIIVDRLNPVAAAKERA